MNEMKMKDNNKKANRWKILFIAIVITASLQEMKTSGNENLLPSFPQRITIYHLQITNRGNFS